MLTVHDLQVPNSWYQDDYDCIAVKAAYRFENGKQTNELIGYRYEILLKEAKNELCKVFIPKKESLFTTDELIACGGTKTVCFETLQLIPYQNMFYKKRLFIRGTASDIKEMVEV